MGGFELFVYLLFISLIQMLKLWRIRRRIMQDSKFDVNNFSILLREKMHFPPHIPALDGFLLLFLGP